MTPEQEIKFVLTAFAIVVILVTPAVLLKHCVL
jgi:hypothetical protein